MTLSRSTSIPKILQINCRFGGSWSQLQQHFRPGVQMIADVPGPRWKIWLVDEARNTAGGVHPFDDDASLQAYLEGPLIAGLRSDRAISDVDARASDVAEELSLGRRAPLGGQPELPMPALVRG